nr:CASP-like protein 4U1 [Penaeus vannamei]
MPTRLDAIAEAHIFSCQFLFGCQCVSGTKRPAHDDDARSDTPPSPIRDEPLSLKVAPRPPPPRPRPPARTAPGAPAWPARRRPASEDEDPRPSKAPRRDADDDEDRGGAPRPRRGGRRGQAHQHGDPRAAVPGRKVQVLETVLLRCGGDVLRAIQTLLYALPPASSAPSPTTPPPRPTRTPTTRNNNNHEQPHRRPAAAPHHHHAPEGLARAPELRHHDFLPDPPPCERRPSRPHAASSPLPTPATPSWASRTRPSSRPRSTTLPQPPPTPRPCCRPPLLAPAQGLSLSPTSQPDPDTE